MKKKMKKAILKMLKTMLIGIVVGVALLLLLAILATHTDGVVEQIIMRCVIIDIMVTFFGVPAYIAYGLIKELATGTLKKVLFGVWAFFVLMIVFITVTILLPTETGSRIVDFFAYAITAGIVISVLVLLFRKVSKSGVPSTEGDLPERRISTLKGYHICGLSANEGIKVSADLYKDRIVFRSGKSEIESIYKSEIAFVSSRSEQEIVGSTTTGKSRTGIASTVALMNGDLAAAYFFRPKTTTYETKNKVETYWFFVLDTTTLSIILQVKSRSALHYFVNLCNDTLRCSEADYEEESAEDYDAEERAEKRISIADMSGTDFEHFCADLLRLNGFSDITVTPSSGDQGVDIVAKKEGVKYAIQCKHYSSPVGNAPVQEVAAGKAYYHCHVGVVLTNSVFTKGAEELAKATDVLLWDNYKLHELIKNAGLSAEYY